MNNLQDELKRMSVSSCNSKSKNNSIFIKDMMIHSLYIYNINENL